MYSNQLRPKLCVKVCNLLKTIMVNMTLCWKFFLQVLQLLLSSNYGRDIET